MSKSVESRSLVSRMSPKFLKKAALHCPLVIAFSLVSVGFVLLVQLGNIYAVVHLQIFNKPFQDKAFFYECLLVLIFQIVSIGFKLSSAILAFKNYKWFLVGFLGWLMSILIKLWGAYALYSRVGIYPRSSLASSVSTLIVISMCIFTTYLYIKRADCEQ